MRGTISLRFDRKLLADVKELAKKENRSINNLTETVLRRLVEKNKQESKDKVT